MHAGIAPPAQADGEGNLIKRTAVLVSLLFVGVALLAQTVGSDGSFNYTYPIEIPPGTNGMQPAISLQYNSSRGHGIMGLGWELQGLGTITRDLQYPVSFGQLDPNVYDDDRFLYNGQKLIPIPNSSGSDLHGAYDAEYVLEIASAHRIRAYNLNSADSFWIVTRPDGTEERYGYSALSDGHIEADLPTSGPALVWALVSITDTNGNYFVVRYYQDQQHPDRQYYPDRIIYTLNDSGGLSSYRCVVFRRESNEHTTVDYLPTRVVTDARIDTVEIRVGTNVDGSGGSVLRKYEFDYVLDLDNRSRLTHIRHMGENAQEPVDEVDVTWSAMVESAATSRVGTYAPMFLAVDFDGCGDEIAQIFESEGARYMRVYKVLPSGMSQWGNDYLLSSDWQPQDGQDMPVYMVSELGIDYPGREDLIEVYSLYDSTYIRAWHYGSGSLLQKRLNTNLDLPWIDRDSWEAYRFFFRDGNQDGTDDLLVIYHDEGRAIAHWWYVADTRFVRSGYTSDVGRWGDFNGRQWTKQYLLTDLTEDGRPDLLALYRRSNTLEGGLYYGISDGRFSGISLQTDMGFWIDPDAPNASLFLPVDLDNNWRTRFMQFHRSSALTGDLVATRWDNGHSVLARGNPNSDYLAPWRFKDEPENVGIQIQDADDDGDSDVYVFSRDDSEFHVRTLSLANITQGGCIAEGAIGPWTPQNATDSTTFVAGDYWQRDGAIISISRIDGDRTGVMLWTVENGSYQPEWSSHYDIGPWRDAHVETTVVTQLQRRQLDDITIIYERPHSGSQQSAIGNDRDGSEISDYSIRVAVHAIDQSDGVARTGGGDRTDLYNYETAERRIGAFHENRSLGFRLITRTDQVGNMYVTHTRNDEPYVGRVDHTETWDVSLGLLEKREYFYDSSTEVAVAGETHASMRVWTTRSIRNVYDGDESSSPDSYAVEYLEYDDYGNLLRSTDYDRVNDPTAAVLVPLSQNAVRSNTVEYAYNVSPTTYIMAPARERFLSGWNQTLSETRYQYDGLSFLGIDKGNLHWEAAENGDDDSLIRYGYDTYGNRVWTRDGRRNDGEYAGNTVEWTYDPVYRTLITGEREALRESSPGVVEWITTDYTYDSLMRRETATEGTGLVTTWTYDLLGWNTTVTRSPDAFPTFQSLPATTTAPRQVQNIQLIEDWGTGQRKLQWFDYYDRMGRLIQKKTTLAWEQYLTVDTHYDHMGNVTSVSIPYITSTSGYTAPHEDQPCHTTSYDALSRVVRETNPDGTYRETVYDRNIVWSIDENRHVTSTERSAPATYFREYTGTFPDPIAYSLQYTYEGTLANGTQVTFRHNWQAPSVTTFNQLGQEVSLSDPDIGHWAYEYDANGNLIEQTDGRGVVTAYEYNFRNQLTAVHYPDDPDVTLTYDQYGRGVASSCGDVIEAFAYDERSRVTSWTRTLAGQSATMSYTYDSADRITSVTYPDGEVLTYEYDDSGQVYAVHSSTGVDYVTSIEYEPTGRISRLYCANGVSASYYYYDEEGEIDPTTSRDQSYRLRRMRLHGLQFGETRADFSYDEAGNVVHKDLHVQRSFESFDDLYEYFTYDELNRLVRAAASGSLASPDYGILDYTYDNMGNITNNDGRSYTYPAQTPLGRTMPHALLDDGEAVFSYDENGNVTGVAGRTEVVVRARATSDSGVAPIMELVVRGECVASWIVESDEFAEYQWYGIADGSGPETEIDVVLANAGAPQAGIVIDWIRYQGETIQDSARLGAGPPPLDIYQDFETPLSGPHWSIQNPDGNIQTDSAIAAVNGAAGLSVDWNGQSRGGDQSFVRLRFTDVQDEFDFGFWWYAASSPAMLSDAPLVSIGAPIPLSDNLLLLCEQSGNSCELRFNRHFPGSFSKRLTPNHWYWIAIHYDHEWAFSKSYLRVFDSAGDEIDSSHQTCAPMLRMREADYMLIGQMADPPPNVDVHWYFDDIAVDFSSLIAPIFETFHRFTVPYGLTSDRTLTYNDANRLEPITTNGSTVSYIYDHRGERAIITEPDGTIIRRFFFGYEEIDYPVEDTESISHYFVNGQRIASRSSATGLQYLHTDHLGSATRATDEHGAIIWDALYGPYGEFIYFDNNSNMEYGYTGQEQDSTDWYYYGARYYSPEIGRFLQPDPLFDGPNPYMYVHGNPVRYVDPTGLWLIGWRPYDMHDSRWASMVLPGSSYQMRSAGCYVSFFATAVSALTWTDVTPDDIVSRSDLFDLNGGQGSMARDAAAAAFGLQRENWTAGGLQDAGSSIEQKLAELDAQRAEYVVGARVNWNPNGPSGRHWVGVSGLREDGGIQYALISPTSLNDIPDKRPAGWWSFDDGQIGIPTSMIYELDAYSTRDVQRSSSPDSTGAREFFGRLFDWLLRRGD